MLKSLSHQEEGEDLKMLEDMLKSDTFKQAKHVRFLSRRVAGFVDVSVVIFCRSFTH